MGETQAKHSERQPAKDMASNKPDAQNVLLITKAEWAAFLAKVEHLTQDSIEKHNRLRSFRRLLRNYAKRTLLCGSGLLRIELRNVSHDNLSVLNAQYHLL